MSVYTGLFLSLVDRWLWVFLGGGGSYLLGGYSACSWIGGVRGECRGVFSWGVEVVYHIGKLYFEMEGRWRELGDG
jgi:hypothetical protein